MPSEVDGYDPFTESQSLQAQLCNHCQSNSKWDSLNHARLYLGLSNLLYLRKNWPWADSQLKGSFQSGFGAESESTTWSSASMVSKSKSMSNSVVMGLIFIRTSCKPRQVVLPSDTGTRQKNKINMEVSLTSVAKSHLVGCKSKTHTSTKSQICQVAFGLQACRIEFPRIQV